MCCWKHRLGGPASSPLAPCNLHACSPLPFSIQTGIAIPNAAIPTMKTPTWLTGSLLLGAAALRPLWQSMEPPGGWMPLLMSTAAQGRACREAWWYGADLDLSCSKLKTMLRAAYKF